MKNHNPDNERIKRRYFIYLKEAKRQSTSSVDAVAQALSRFESYTRHKDFKAFHHLQAVAFKTHLASQHAERTGKPLSKATLHATTTNLKRFFQWLALQPGYKSRIQYADADYFNLSENDTRTATARREQRAPTLEQVKHVIATMPAETDIQRRNRTLIAFTLLTGARDSAISTMHLKHVDLMAGCVYQDSRDVKTKFAKTFTTYFFPVGEDVLGILGDWVNYLREELLWGNDDPLFPATKIACGESRQFEAIGLDRKCWSNATPIRTVFKEAFESAGLPYFNPHSLRNTLVRLGEQLCQTPEEFKSWSQNLGHEQVLTTFTSYGAVSSPRQGEIIAGLAKPRKEAQTDVSALAEALGIALRENLLTIRN